MSALIALLLLAAPGPRLVVVVHKDAEVKAVSRVELSRVLFGKVRELSGRRVAPLVVGTAEERSRFVARAANQSISAAEQMAITLELNGEGRRPVLVEAPADLVRRVLESQSISGRPAVLGCMSLEMFKALPDSQRAQLRVLSIDGHTPDEADYPLVLDP